MISYFFKISFSVCVCVFLFFLSFLGPHLWHMEVPRLGVESEYRWWPTPEPQQLQIQATSAACTAAHGYVGSMTH